MAIEAVDPQVNNDVPNEVQFALINNDNMDQGDPALQAMFQQLMNGMNANVQQNNNGQNPIQAARQRARLQGLEPFQDAVDSYRRCFCSYD
jgi:hypothetical protein